MNFNTLLETFGAGFALDRLDQLRVAAAGVATVHKCARDYRKCSVVLLRKR